MCAYTFSWTHQYTHTHTHRHVCIYATCKHIQTHTHTHTHTHITDRHMLCVESMFLKQPMCLHKQFDIIIESFIMLYGARTHTHTHTRTCAVVHLEVGKCWEKGIL